ncbi:G-type lectin S-receptor-like serine/threonine-protein kinase LECRK2 [Quercus lobata]|uniref:Receptor-like serine/threonine-protein kinase n=1 Tax=Quercus lobata TaxID=97700 RepID=A0A7N2LZ60_QUELO|nr:G-type lectin S-receptor-like serine/threonine-protein kinase LECRK2 [Quercus lobata]
MESINVLFLLSTFLLAVDVKAQPNNSINVMIPLGSSLSPSANRTSWLSPSGLFAFGFYPQGNGFAIGIWLVDQPQNTIVWTAYRNNSPVTSKATLDLTRDGKLLFRTEEGEENPVADVSAASASMLDSGNFVLYDNSSDVIWESFEYPTDTILGGQNVSYGKDLVSSVSGSDHSSGRFYLRMQSDGNLVSYPVNNTDNSENAYWSSATIISDNFASGVHCSANKISDNVAAVTTDPYERGAVGRGGCSNSYTRSCGRPGGYGGSRGTSGGSIRLSLNQRGLLSLIDCNSSIISVLVNNSYSGDKETTIIYRAILDSDGILKLYSHRFFGNKSSEMIMEWSSLVDQCDVKGFCGFNSYCLGMGFLAECLCFPGFHFVNHKNKFLGCNDKFSVDGCSSSNGPMIPHYSTALPNISWGDYPYSMVRTKQENCESSCLDDCNCGAALYMNGTCNKYKLPLRYGRSQNLSAIAFFKDRRNGDHHRSNPKILMDGKKKIILILSLSLGSIACLCSVIAISCFFQYRRQVHWYRKLSENVNVGFANDFTLRSFSYNELESATDGFSQALSTGSFGSVYKGSLSIGSVTDRTIAVKRLEKFEEEGERKFQGEMTAIGRTHHKNLVQLLGFCIEGTRKLLVYDYMTNGSLADLLFKAKKRPLWKERVRIALEVARGIYYLHQECEVHIIHCNLKPENILMDDTWTAKISDFGLARLSVPNQTRTTMGIEGTSGYSAPEWQKKSLISVKADIYSFGVMLLEIVCCRSNIEVNVSTADEILLSSWVYNCFVVGELDKLVEEENVDMKTLERMVKVGLWCIQEDPALRPPMKNVILMLEGTMDIAVPPSPAISYS